MTISGAERQRRFRERHARRLAQERAARRERQRVLALHAVMADPACFCCAERASVFLITRDGRVCCRNCDHALVTFGYCPAHGPGISARIG